MHIDEYVPEPRGDSPDPYQDENLSYEEGWDETIDHQSSPMIDPASPAMAGWEQGPFRSRSESPEPIRAYGGINERGNEYKRVDYKDKSYKYSYENTDQSRYERHRDGSAHFDSGRGFTKDYPAPDSGVQVRREEHGRVDGRDASPRYPVSSQDVPATRRQEIEQPELADSTESRVKEGHERYRNQESAKRLLVR